MKKFDQFHPLLNELLTKLADPENTTKDCWGERFDWVKAGCPVAPTVPMLAVKDDACPGCLGLHGECGC